MVVLDEVCNVSASWTAAFTLEVIMKHRAFSLALFWRQAQSPWHNNRNRPRSGFLRRRSRRSNLKPTSPKFRRSVTVVRVVCEVAVGAATIGARWGDGLGCTSRGCPQANRYRPRLVSSCRSHSGSCLRSRNSHRSPHFPHTASLPSISMWPLAVRRRC